MLIPASFLLLGVTYFLFYFLYLMLKPYLPSALRYLFPFTEVVRHGLHRVFVCLEFIYLALSWSCLVNLMISRGVKTEIEFLLIGLLSISVGLILLKYRRHYWKLFSYLYFNLIHSTKFYVYHTVTFGILAILFGSTFIAFSMYLFLGSS
jgi:hypothetical protein